MTLLKDMAERFQRWTADNPGEHLIGDLFMDAVGLFGCNPFSYSYFDFFFLSFLP